MSFPKKIIKALLFSILGCLVLTIVAIIMVAVPRLLSGDFPQYFALAVFIGGFASFYGSIPLALSHFAIEYLKKKSRLAFIIGSLASIATAAGLGLWLAYTLQSVNAWESPDLLIPYCAISILSITALTYFLNKKELQK